MKEKRGAGACSLDEREREGEQERDSSPSSIGRCNRIGGLLGGWGGGGGKDLLWVLLGSLVLADFWLILEWREGLSWCGADSLCSLCCTRGARKK